MVVYLDEILIFSNDPSLTHLWWLIWTTSSSSSGSSLSLCLTYGPTPNGHVSNAPDRTVIVLKVRTPVKVKKAQVYSKKTHFQLFLEASGRGEARK